MSSPSKSPAGSARHDEDVVEEATTWFVRLRADLVSADDRRAFEAWLAHDPAHPEAYAQAEALWGEIGGMPDPRLQDPPYDRSAHPAPQVRFRRWQAVRTCGAAACVALVAVVGLWSAGGYDWLRADHVTAVGETRRVTLADGTTLQLNTDTAVAVDFSQSRRRVELYRGQAYFAVAKDESRPFEVIAGQGLTRALGTAFDVLDAARSVTVAVEEGKVRVSRPQGPGTESVTLGAGEAARYGRSGVIEVRQGDLATAWRQGKLVFSSRPLGDVVAELDRYRPGAIVVLDSRIAQARFTGVLDLRDTDQALAAIEGSLAVDVLKVTPYLTFLDARD